MAARRDLRGLGRDDRRARDGSPWWDSGALSLLVADEDPAARAGLQALVGAGVGSIQCSNGGEALWHAGREDPMVLILSATLPVVSAADVASVVAQHTDGQAMILVGVGVGDADRAAPVLAAGADRVVSRPYRSREIEPLLRPYLMHMEVRRLQTAVLTVGALELNGPAFEARAAGRPLRLTLQEFQLLRLFMVHAGDVVSQDHIRQQLWTSRGESVSANTIAVHVRQLRIHLRDVADIVTVRTVGYRLQVRDRERTETARSGDERSW